MSRLEAAIGSSSYLSITISHNVPFMRDHQPSHPITRRPHEPPTEEKNHKKTKTNFYYHSHSQPRKQEKKEKARQDKPSPVMTRKNSDLKIAIQQAFPSLYN
jgi:hypothetical protein